MPKDESGWKNKLTPEQYSVLREKGTEAPFSGKLLHEERGGTFKCAACGNPLFASDAKFTTNISGLQGWPSFDEALPGAVAYQEDTSQGMHRVEVVCAECGSHLGHVFDDDSETKTGKHYCLNSVCLEFQPKGTETA